jgi:chromate reductase
MPGMREYKAVMQVLAISGSLRAWSSNSAALQAASLLAPEGMSIALYSGLDNLPHFNPDRDHEPLPTTVAELRERVAGSDGLLISSPEYAHGIPGSLKNALDWLVGSTDFAGKPVVIINTAPRAVHADAQLREVLVTMAARLVGEKSFALPLSGKQINAAGIADDPETALALRYAMGALADAVDGIRPANAASCSA